MNNEEDRLTELWTKFQTGTINQEVSEFKILLQNNPEFGSNFPMPEYVTLLHLYSPPAAYGKRLEKRIRKDYGLAKINNHGDAIFAGLSTEIKSSIVSKDQITANWNQIRIYDEDVQQYILMIFDIRLDYKEYLFILSKSQMSEAAAIYKTTHSNYSGKSIRLKPDLNDTEFKSWVEKYSKTFNNLNNIDLTEQELTLP